MTKLQEQIYERVEILIRDGNQMSFRQESFNLPEYCGKIEGWVSSIGNIIDFLRFGESHSYRRTIAEVVRDFRKLDDFPTTPIAQLFSKARYLLDSLSADIRIGLIGDFESTIGGEIYDNILDHAEEYHESGHKFSGVVAGVAFEDTMKKLGKRHQIESEKVDDIISELTKKQLFTTVKAKRARVAADVRTKATHASWEEFGLKDVKACIDFTRELIDEHFS